MHRADAATVSFTEIAVSSRGAVMRYHAGAPCQRCECSFLALNHRFSVPHLGRRHSVARIRFLRKTPRELVSGAT
jgi:hypothetical protein